MKNTGTKDTEDVVQLYIKDTSECAVPNYSLCGFKRVFLKAGESIKICINIDKTAFEVVDENGIRAIKGKTFTLFAGTSQPDALSEKLNDAKCLSTQINL